MSTHADQRVGARKIDVMIAGAQKAGTSSLKALLEQHPSINGHVPLECDYFAKDSEDWDAYYDAHFLPDTQSTVTIGKLAHLAQYPKYLAKLREHNPHVRLIFVLREPLSRLYSSYEMQSKTWVDFSPDRFSAALQAHRGDQYDVVYNTFILLGDYAKLASNMLDVFPRQNILFIDFQDLKDRPIDTASMVFYWLSLDAHAVQPIHENIGRSVKSKWLSRLLFTAGQSKLRRALETLFGRRLLLAARAALDQVNTSSKRKDQHTGPASAHVKFDANTLAELRDYYDDADAKFTKLTGHVPAWKKTTG